MPKDYSPIPCETNRPGGLITLLESISPLDDVVEIGCYRGVSTEVLALFSHRRLYAIDPWPDIAIYLAFIARMTRYTHVVPVRKYGHSVASHFHTQSLDLVYIDGNHSYAAVQADIRDWLPKVRRGGWIGGHDWTCGIAGIQVTEAVTDLLGPPDRIFDDSSWLIRVR